MISDQAALLKFALADIETKDHLYSITMEWMFPSAPSRQPHELSSAKARNLSALIIILVILGFWGAGTLTGGALQILLYNILAALLSIGVVSLLYELRLRRTVEAELLRLVGIERSLSSHYLSAAGDASQITWSNMLDDASTFRILLAEPGSWVHTHWNMLIKGGQERQISIEFFFPNPDGDWLPRIAEYLNMPKNDLAGSIKQASRIAENRWKNDSDADLLIQGSTIQVRYFDGFPTQSMVRADNMLITIFYSSTSRPQAETGFALGFDGPASTYPISWYNAELDRLSEGPLQYENVVRDEK